MSNMRTLHEIAVKYARKQSGMADSLTEEAPILQHVRWNPASHGLWNVAEKLTDIEGPAFVRPDAPLPQLSVSSDLVTTDLSVMGGVLEVPSQRALKFGGPMKYFADKQNYILKKAGMDTERQLVLENWLKAAVEYEDGASQHLGSVVTNGGYSDWATTAIDGSIRTMWYRLSRREDDYRIECSRDGVNFSQMRICHMHKGGGIIRFGLYTCSPEDSSFTAVFSQMRLMECQWQAHDGQQPDQEA